MASSFFRKIVWFTLLVGGGATLVLLFIFERIGWLAIGFLVWFLLIFIWGIFSQWLFGLRRHLRRHLGQPIDQLTFVSKEVGTSRLADMIRSLESYHQDLPKSKRESSRFGIATYQELRRLKTNELAVERLSWRTVELDEAQLVNVPENAVYLSSANQIPFVAWIGFEQPNSGDPEDVWTTGRGNQVQVCCRGLDEANQVIRWLLDQSSAHSVYRGRMVQVSTSLGSAKNQSIRMIQRPQADRNAIILPVGIVELLERLVRATNNHRDQLRELGHSAKLGLLLHGPPGTGKTLVTKYLIQSCPEHTIISPTDMAVETLRECFRLAKYLPPAILVLEDVDLLAPQRDSRPTLDGLQELMNQLDGLASNSQAIVIMSTNRPDVLEPALAARPGRISQAVAFPLPDVQERMKLLELYLNDSVNEEDQDWLVEYATRIQGKSPAFICELSKRAILLSLERKTDSKSATKVDEEDLRNALAELILGDESINTKTYQPEN
ncbi:MAG: ATP-binding protein [Rubripirellula sp.]